MVKGTFYKYYYLVIFLICFLNTSCASIKAVKNRFIKCHLVYNYKLNRNNDRIPKCFIESTKALRVTGRLYWTKNYDDVENDLDKVLKCILESVDLNPYDVEALRVAGRLYLIKKKYEKAEYYLKKAITRDDQNSITWSDLGWVYGEKQQYSKMQDAFEKAIKYSVSNSPVYQIGLGRAYYWMGEYDLAEKHFQRALDMKSEFYNELKKNYDRAFQCSIATFDLNNHDKEAFLYRQGKDLHDYFQNSITMLTSITWNGLGWTYGVKQQYPKMRDAFEKAIKNRSSGRYQIGLGRAYYNMQEYDLAEKHFQKALDVKSESESRPEAKLWLGKTLYIRGNLESSDRYFNDYLFSEPEKHVAYRSLGRFYYRMEKLDQAEEYLKKALQINNEYADGWNNLGWLYYKKEEYSKMLYAFAKAIQFRKNKEDVYDRAGLASAYYFLEDYERSEKFINQVSNLVKNDLERDTLSIPWILLAIKRRDFELAKKLWSTHPCLGAHMYIENNEGYIHYLDKGLLAHLAGLMVGDRIILFNGEPLLDNGSLYYLKKKLKYNQTIDVLIRRGNDILTKKIVLNYEHYLPKTVIASQPDIFQPITEPDEPELKEREIKDTSEMSQIIVIFYSRKKEETKRPVFKTKLKIECPNGVSNIRLLDRYKGKERELADYQMGIVNDQIYLACKGKMLNSLNDFSIPDVNSFLIDISYTFMDVDIQHELVVEVTSKAGETASNSIQILRKKPEVYLITYGNNNFDHFNNLKFAEKDITDLLKSFAGEVNHFQISGHTYGGLIDQINSRLEDGDIIVAAVSSHGFLFEDVPYIAVTKSNPKADDTSIMRRMAIPLQKFLDDILSMPAQKAINPTLIIIDACHSGGGFGVFGTSSNRLNKRIQQTIAGTHAVVFLSAPSLEVSLDGSWFDGRKVENGVLFFHVREALKKGDKDNNGLTFKELNQFLAERGKEDPNFDPVVQVSPNVELYHLTFKVEK